MIDDMVNIMEMGLILEAETNKNNSKRIKKEIFEKNIDKICEIYCNDNKGTGFICMIPDPENNNHNIEVLLTCYHVASIDKIKTIYYKFENHEKKEINFENKDRRKWYNKELDYACIEMLEKDNIINCLNIDENLYENNYTKINLYNKIVLVFTTFQSEELSFGQIKNIRNSKLLYTNDTTYGWSGSPVIRKDNNEVIAIHQGAESSKKINIGILLKYILMDMKKEKINYDEEWSE